MTAASPMTRHRTGGETSAQKRARRHSRWVRVLRVLLPLTGLAILAGMVGLIAVFNYLSSLGLGNISLSTDGLVMDRPELSGHDGERSYKVSAVRAIQRLSDPRVIDLETIHADIVLNPSQSAQLTALKGTYDNGEETLTLYDGLQVSWSEGYTIDLTDVAIDLKTGAMRTSDPISIRSDKGHIRAGQLDYDQDKGIVRFTDGIRMVLNSALQEKEQE
ncbi:LPS export ABC transporter periplasmic protein LptC [Roseibium aestuarii]|uniref:LPS export ABC transporter periplasmic protein LptC n=1 Tax=Roseibium aestuarii TaxID=2600299 RepID=A0ABW4JVX0_9HYPH|nr:LPS export ABC transporter periplasmic protein LptC [Roseibium aestuarii]